MASKTVTPVSIQITKDSDGKMVVKAELRAEDEPTVQAWLDGTPIRDASAQIGQPCKSQELVILWPC